MSVPWPVQVDIVAAFSLLGFVLVCIPLYWHLEAWNVGCVMYIFWIGTQSLFQFINAVVWRDNAINWAPAWCDISECPPTWFLPRRADVSPSNALQHRDQHRGLLRVARH